MKLNRYLIALLCMIWMICTMQVADAALPDIKLAVNGKSVATDAPPYIENGRTLVPVRFVAESFGADVEWNGSKREVTVTGNGINILLKIDSNIALVNGKKQTLDAQARIKYDRTYIPVRFISETFGYNVDWDGTTRTVHILRPQEALSRVVGIDVWQESQRQIIAIKGTRGMAYRNFTLSNPERYIIDIPDAEIALSTTQIPVNNGNVVQIRASQFQKDPAQVRIVIDLDQAVLPEVKAEGNQIILAFENQSNNDNSQNSGDPDQGTDIVNDGNGNITDIKTNVSSGSTLLTIEGDIPEHYSIFHLSLPNRIVLDFPNSYHRLPQKNWDINGELIKQIKTAQYDNSPPTVRIVLESEGVLQYRIKEKSDHQMIVELFKASNSDKPGKTVVLDAGHGGKDPGTSGPSGAHEKDTTLIIAQLLRGKLENAGYNVVMTRADDTYISLQERVNIANNVKADLFVSIHHNWFSNPDVNGIGTYYYKNYTSQETKTLASSIQQGIISTTGLADRKIISCDFYVVRETVMPAVLIECGFMSNPNEEKLIIDPQFQEKAAQGIYQGIEKYFLQVNNSDALTKINN